MLQRMHAHTATHIRIAMGTCMHPCTCMHTHTPSPSPHPPSSLSHTHGNTHTHTPRPPTPTHLLLLLCFFDHGCLEPSAPVAHSLPRLPQGCPRTRGHGEVLGVSILLVHTHNPLWKQQQQQSGSASNWCTPATPCGSSGSRSSQGPACILASGLRCCATAILDSGSQLQPCNGGSVPKEEVLPPTLPHHMQDNMAELT